MVIDDLDAVGVPVLETKTQAPLIVYPNAKLSSTVALQGLQSVRRGYAQVLNAPRDVEHLKLPLGDRLKGPEAFRRLAEVQGLRMLAAEGLDHRERVKRQPLNGKHYIGESGAVQAESPMRSGGSTADNRTGRSV
jgi:hypothetical protein